VRRTIAPGYGVNVLVGLGDLLKDAVAGSARLMTGEEVPRNVTVVNVVIGIGMYTHDLGPSISQRLKKANITKRTGLSWGE